MKYFGRYVPLYNKYVCTCCGRPLPQGEYYLNYNEMNKVIDVLELARDLVKSEDRKVQQKSGDSKLMDAYTVVHNKFSKSYAKRGELTNIGERIDDYKKNVIARAEDKRIESKNFAWQELNIPFKYENKNTPKGMLVTISTNKEAGKASSDKNNLDVIYVDDIAMIYNSGLKSAQYKNTNLSFADNKAAIEIEGKANEADFSIASDGEGAYISKVLKTNEGETGKSTLYITITSNDLQKSNCFEVAITDKTATGIFNIKSDSNATSSTLYNLAGQQVSNSYKGIIIKNGKKYINK